jgi:hypothetical protein
MPAVALLSTGYLHYFVFQLKAIELDPEVNIGELITLEAMGESMAHALVELDIFLGIAGFIIMGMIAMILFIMHM